MPETAAQGRGRLTPERTEEVYAAVVSILLDAGYERLTMDAVARAASCSKATLYRQWGGKEHLVIDAIETTKPNVPTADINTGTLPGDLHQWARRAANAPEKSIQIMTAVMHACTTSPDLRNVIRERIVINREDDDFARMFIRAIERGEIARDAQAFTYLPAILAGSFLIRQLLEDNQPDEDYLVGLIDSVLLPAFGIAQDPST